MAKRPPAPAAAPSAKKVVEHPIQCFRCCVCVLTIHSSFTIIWLYIYWLSSSSIHCWNANGWRSLQGERCETQTRNENRATNYSNHHINIMWSYCSSYFFPFWRVLIYVVRGSFGCQTAVNGQHDIKSMTDILLMSQAPNIIGCLLMILLLI